MALRTITMENMKDRLDEILELLTWTKIIMAKRWSLEGLVTAKKYKLLIVPKAKLEQSSPFSEYLTPIKMAESAGRSGLRCLPSMIWIVIES